MHHGFIILSLLGALIAGCKGGPPAASARITSSDDDAWVKEAWSSPNEAAPPRTRSARPPAPEVGARAAAERRIEIAIESARTRIEALEVSLRAATVADERATLAGQLADANTEVDHLEAFVEPLHGASDRPWEDVSAEIDATIFKLNQALGNRRQNADPDPSLSP